MTTTEPLILPHDYEAESGVLGSMLIAPADCVPLMARLLQAADFHHPPHQTIFTAILEEWHDYHTLDLITITGALRDLGKLEGVGGAAYLSQLFTFTPTAANVDYYAARVKTAAHLRLIWKTCTDAAREACCPGADVAELTAPLVQMLHDLASNRPQQSLTMADHVRDALERYEAASVGAGAPEGVLPTSIRTLDAELVGGFYPGELVVVAAETSGGKSAFAGQVSVETAVRGGGAVLVASYEMSARQLTDRMLALESEIPSNVLRSGMIPETDAPRLGPAAERLAASNIHLRDAIGHWTVDDVAAEARALHAQGGLLLVVVDYLQLAAPRSLPRGAQRNREREVAEISRGLKALAGELSIPVLALSQLNEDGRLRESRAIGQDADVVLIIGEDPDGRDDHRTLKIDKQRNGARDRAVCVAWDGPLMRFRVGQWLKAAKIGEPLPQA